MHSIRPALPSDLQAVQTLLVRHGLPLEGIPRSLDGFFVAEHTGSLVGVAGLEGYGEAALLRSVAVVEGARGTGSALVRHALETAERSGIREVFLLTTTAERFFPRFGFVPADRGEVPTAVRASAEFQGACPASAALLVCRIGPGDPGSAG